MREPLQRIFAIASKEIRQLKRDRLSFGMIVGIPLLQIVLFGYAINTDVRHLAAGVADQAHTQLARELVAQAQASQVLDVTTRAASATQLEQLLRDGRIEVGIYIPPDFNRRVLDGTRQAAQLLVDGSDPTIQNVAESLRNMPLALHDGLNRDPVPTFEIRDYYNPERRSSVQIVPSLIGVILTLTMVLFTAIAIVRERERGNLELLITTPVSTAELMLGKIVPYIGIGLVQVSIVLLMGVWLFDVPVRGSLMDLYVAALIFITASLSLGLLISTFAQTQFQAVQLTIFTFLPSILLSGFMFPFNGMPVFAQWLGQLLPLTHFVRLIRGIVLRGAGIGGMLPDVYALLAFFAVFMLITVLKFHKRLD
ncbi:MAG TPA: ABC transporter permease [Gammaproteobacteria bacterium]|nr:ABC transporter permease [Gammaproteobacteria bacterium]